MNSGCIRDITIWILKYLNKIQRAEKLADTKITRMLKNLAL